MSSTFEVQTRGMNHPPASYSNTATALRLAMGPGFGFAGPSEELLAAAVSSAPAGSAQTR